MDFLPDFGKHAFYVWSCYGATAIVFGYLTIKTLIENKSRK